LNYLLITVFKPKKTHIKPKKTFPFDYVHPDSLNSYLSSTSTPICVIYVSNEPHGPHAKGTSAPDAVIIPEKWLNTEKTRRKLTGYYADIAILDKEFNNFLTAINQHRLETHSLSPKDEFKTCS